MAASGMDKSSTSSVKQGSVEDLRAFPFLWVALPVCVAWLGLGLPRLLRSGHVPEWIWLGTDDVADSTCTTLALFWAISLFVGAWIDEHALHSLFFGGKFSQRAAGFCLPAWLCGLHWLIGQAIVVSLLRICSVTATASTPGGEAAKEDVSTELSLAFLGITYLDLVFAIACLENRKLRGHMPCLQLYLGATKWAVVYGAFIAYLAACHGGGGASFLTFAVGSDAAMVLIIPFLQACALTPRLLPRRKEGESEACHTKPRPLRPVVPRSRATWPGVTYLALLSIAIASASPKAMVELLPVASKIMAVSGISLSSKFDGLFDEALDGARRLATFAMSWNQAQQLPVGPIQLVVGLILAELLRRCFFGGGSADANISTKKSAYAPDSVSRRRLTKMRASSHLFPPPYPNGWYALCTSVEVPANDSAIAASACNREFAVFRSKETGEVAVLHAFCPHLGTHLGHGGKVVGNTVVCPYHSWAFDPDGKCVSIPYCPKEPTPRTNTKAFPCRERFGIIFIWLHAEDEPPFYELSCLDDIETMGMEFISELSSEDWQMHVTEPSQNAADPFHFNTMHSWLGAEEGKRSCLWIKHNPHSRLSTMGHKKLDGSDMDPYTITLHDATSELWLFGLIPVPSIFLSLYDSGAVFQGPAVSTFFVNSPLLGALRVIVCFTPMGPWTQRLTLRCYATGFPRFLARWVARMSLATINQDRTVWEHKLAVAPRNVVAGDGPFALYGTWLNHFYSASSRAWGDLSLEW